jgi:hypothetical protein
MKTRTLNIMNMRFLLILFAMSIFSCHEPLSDAEKLNNLINESDAIKMDQIMTLWFDEFNIQQAQGEDMTTADNLAVKAVIESTPSESVTTH